MRLVRSHRQGRRRMTITFTMPIHLRSAANVHEGRWRRHREVAKRRQDVGIVAQAAGVRPITGSVRVTLTRVAPRQLDGHDNLRNAFKAAVDSLAQVMGLKSDRDPRVVWEYAQERGKPSAVRVEIR